MSKELNIIDNSEENSARGRLKGEYHTGKIIF
jgi:hypothetical protein